MLLKEVKMIAKDMTIGEIGKENYPEKIENLASAGMGCVVDAHLHKWKQLKKLH